MRFLRSLFARSKITDLSTQGSITAAIKDLKNDDSAIRIKAAAKLGRFKTDEVADALADALKDTELMVRVKAAESLGKIANHRSALPLSMGSGFGNSLCLYLRLYR